MKTTMQNIKEMVDVNTILGDPVETPDGNVIIPISRVTFGFAAGGTEFEPAQGKGKENRAAAGAGGGEEKAKIPFGGGSGAGITLHPVAFLVVGKDQTRLLPVEGNVLVDRILDVAPQLIEKLQALIRPEGPRELPH